jgi:hypothetical protein
MSPRGRLPALVLGSLLWAMPLLAAAVPAASTPATADIRDIRGPLPIFVWWRWLALGGGALLVAGLGGVAVVLIRRRRSRPLAPHERALQRLEQAQQLAAAGQAREYAAAASDAVREYIEECFVVRAAHLTTEEFFADLLAHESSPLGSQRESLLPFLEACDLGKFARYPLPRDGMAELNERARQFVLATARRPANERPAPARTP